ncbi:claudin-23-like [Hoplias malabaricus]|uniref:claudin-23-like n=1 Tax=Hoplias malabaricus TaxID=27720 RepID=UPI003461CE90
MRTPGIIIFGLVLSPCGWILDLTSTVAPNWRVLSGVNGQTSDARLNEGIWDICQSFTTTSTVNCNLRNTDPVYFSSQIIPIAQGMMVASLVVTLIGLAVVTPGARCWRDRPPRWPLVSFGAVLIFCSGVLTIIPIAWYTHLLPSLNSTYTFINPSNSNISVGYCIVLGYIGGIMEVLAGAVLFVGVCRCCDGKNRGEKPHSATITHHRPRTTASHAHTYASRPQRPAPRPRTHAPTTVSSSSTSAAASTADDDLYFPGQSKGTVNPSFRGTPYDADL